MPKRRLLPCSSADTRYIGHPIRLLYAETFSNEATDIAFLFYFNAVQSPLYTGYQFDQSLWREVLLSSLSPLRKSYCTPWVGGCCTLVA